MSNTNQHNTMKAMTDYTVGFCDYAGRLHKGTGILANCISSAISTAMDWIWDNRKDARECSIAFVMDAASGKILYGIDPTGMFTCDQTPVIIPNMAG
jgi:hypothetical protein